MATSGRFGGNKPTSPETTTVATTKSNDTKAPETQADQNTAGEKPVAPNIQTASADGKAGEATGTASPLTGQPQSEAEAKGSAGTAAFESGIAAGVVNQVPEGALTPAGTSGLVSTEATNSVDKKLIDQLRSASVSDQAQYDALKNGYTSAMMGRIRRRGKPDLEGQPIGGSFYYSSEGLSDEDKEQLDTLAERGLLVKLDS